MSLLNDIQSQLSPDAIGKIGSMLGLGGNQAQQAVKAAVPSMMSGVIDLAKTPAGADKLGSALKGMDLSALANPTQALGGAGLGDIGGKLLGGLFGQSAFGSLGNVIGKFAGISGDGIGGKLIAMIAPLVLGNVAKKWIGGGGTPQGLTGLLNSEKDAVKAAMPAGLNLGNVFGSASSMVPNLTVPSAPPAGGLMKFILPLGILAAALLGLWYYFSTRDDAANAKGVPTKASPTMPVPDPKALAADIPDYTKVQGDVTSMFETLGTTIGGIKDEASLTAAAPKLTEFQTKATGLKAILDKLPDMGKRQVIELIRTKLVGLKEMIAKVALIPGLGDKLKPVNGLFETLEGYTK